MRNIEFPSFAVFNSANKMILTISFLNIFFLDEKNGNYSMLLGFTKAQKSVHFPGPGRIFLFSKGCVHTLVAERKWPSTIRAGQSTGNGVLGQQERGLIKLLNGQGFLCDSF